MNTENRIEIVNLQGGLIGLLLTNPQRALQKATDEANRQGWRVHQVMEYGNRNLAMVGLQLLVLALTLGLWTWGGGYLLLLEKQPASALHKG